MRGGARTAIVRAPPLHIRQIWCGPGRSCTVVLHWADMSNPQQQQATSQPWSHRRSAPVRTLITVLSALGSALVATFASRIGAAYNMPVGLVIAFALLGMSAWCARSRGGITGFAVHMLCSTLLIYLIAQGWPNGDAVIVGFHNTELPWLSLYCGVIWLYGSILLQVIMLFLPARWFTIPERRADD